ncbi:MAG: hypothetical protein J6A49_00575 [Clostridia bacterium]|nr:hypothetical protein [Clostridia bacterium]
MKKTVIIMLTLVFIFQSIPFVSAYTFNENPFYSIDMPEEFEAVGEDKFIADNDSNLSVSIVDNTEEKFCVADLNDSELKEYAETIASEGEEAFKSLDMDAEMTVVSYEKIKHPSGKTAVIIVFKTVATQNNKQRIRFQKLYEFTGVNNKFTFTYTATEKSQINDLDAAFDSIVINEEQIQGVGDKMTTAALFGGVVLLLLIGIIRFIRTPLKRKK